jgi:hypothetical protein
MAAGTGPYRSEDLMSKVATEAGYSHEGLLLREQPAAYYRTTADHYRNLLAETTTPRLTRYLGEMIVRCERLAREIEGTFSD